MIQTSDVRCHELSFGTNSGYNQSNCLVIHQAMYAATVHLIVCLKNNRKGLKTPEILAEVTEIFGTL
jgi:hypothetical protein